MEGTGSEQRMVRDAARLRAVMGRSSDQHHETPDTPDTPDARATRLIAPKIIRTVPDERREYSRHETHLRAPVREEPPVTEEEKEMVPVDLPVEAAIPVAAPTPMATPKPSASPHFEHTISYAQLEEIPTIRLDEDPRSSSVPIVKTRRIRGFTPLVGLAIVVGLGVGVGLYATFGDQISGLFSGKRESIPSGNPAMVTERPAGLDVTSASINGELGRDPTTIEAPATLAPSTTARETRGTPTETSSQSSGQEARAVPPHAPESATRAERDGEPMSRTAATARTTAASATTREITSTRETAVREATTATRRSTMAEVTSATTAQRYTVQIRSTSDETEATRIAQRLRSKGAKNVRVEKWSKDGAEMYRVRYGAFASSSEAQAESERLGHDNIWIVKRP